ncbi:DNA-binding transcriptional regulator, MarR family [Carnobacterium alterfunditum]|uniref:DNA-binding transcriptional regulator, MarR family n=1 Tax=Carnobacterium alterfunditum TaxID=28230 RepID=A0A1N6F0X7_9LACT|nr:MarR family transcriptional regulator [Carnobacterium alterfunditum]SIN88889.1 DNA-binding transcriptional regulator, MarR family [Carnobacterium alterfunditum]
MKESIMDSRDVVSRFCRLQMNKKMAIPIRASEMGALIFVQKSEDKVTPLMISNFFGIAKPSVTDMIDSLIKKTYLIKIPSKIDRRSYTVEVTGKGYELLESTAKEYLKTMDLLEEKMGDQKFSLFIQLLQEANELLSEE